MEDTLNGLYLDISHRVIGFMLSDMQEVGITAPYFLKFEYDVWEREGKEVGRMTVTDAQAEELIDAIWGVREGFAAKGIDRDRVYYAIPLHLRLEKLMDSFPREETPEEAKYGVPYTGELFAADPGCDHRVKPQPGGGIKCTKCRGWFCY